MSERAGAYRVVSILGPGAVRVLRQGVKYEAGRAVSYRCPDCGELHPLDARDWDEARGLYVGRFCAGKVAVPRNSRAGHAAYQRERYWSDPIYRERRRATVREQRARRRAGGGAMAT